MTQALYGFYVSFSGESPDNAVRNVYALNTDGKTVSTQVLGPGPEPYHGLRGMAFGPDGNFYVAQGVDKDHDARKDPSVIFQFSGTPAKDGTLKYLGRFVTPDSSPGLSHPYQPVFSGGDLGDLYVSSQNANVVTAFYGPKSASPGKPMPNSQFLRAKYQKGTFSPGTFVPAFSAKEGVPAYTPVPTDDGGLTFTKLPAAGLANGLDVENAADKNSPPPTHSVRGLAFDDRGNLYVADEAAHRVTVFNTAGTLLGEIKGGVIKGDPKFYQLRSPVALFFAPKLDDKGKEVPGGTLYIGSAGNRSLFTYDVSGVAKKEFVAEVFKSDATQLNKLSGIAVDPDGNVYTGQRGAKAKPAKTAEEKQHPTGKPEGNMIYKWTRTATGAEPHKFAGPFGDSPEQIIAVYRPLVGA
jgi:NHL repeat